MLDSVRGEGILVDAEERGQLPRAFSEGAPPLVVETLSLKVINQVFNFINDTITVAEFLALLTCLQQSPTNDRLSLTSVVAAFSPDSVSLLDLAVVLSPTF